jgi:hypothetical protein
VRVVLRLKVEDKPYASKFNINTQLQIMETIKLAVERCSMVDDYFEIIVTTENNYVEKCLMKMSEEIYDYFLKSYGNKKNLEKDYQVIFLKTA